MTTADSAYIVTVTRDPQAVPAYLYSHSGIVASFAPIFQGTGPNVLLIKTTAQRDALTWATSQAERLSSGLHWSRAFATESEARAHVEEVFA